MDIEWHQKPYANVITNQPLADLYEINARAVGVRCEDAPLKDPSSGSTDMGNVSYVLPSIHPMYAIGTDEANHTRGFTVATGKVMSEQRDGESVIWVPSAL